MKPFVPLIFVVILCCLAMFFGDYLFETQKYVMLSYGKLYIKTTLFSALLVLIGFWVAIRLVIMIVRKVLGLSSFTRLYLFNKSEKKAREDLNQGLTAFLLQDWTRAERLTAGAGDHSGLSDPRYLFAAAAANEIGEDDRVQSHLSQIDASNKDVILFKADLLLKQGEPELALGLLQPLYDKKPKDEALLNLYVSILERLGQWDTLLSILAKVEKVAIYEEQRYLAFSAKVVSSALRESARTKTIDAAQAQWKKLPGKYKKRNDMLAAYIGVLSVNGKSDVAEDLLLKAVKKHSVGDFVNVFRQVTFSQPTTLNQYLQSELKKDEHNVDLLCALGHLAVHSKDYELASKALTKVVESKSNKADLLALANAYGNIAEHEKANVIYQKFVS